MSEYTWSNFWQYPGHRIGEFVADRFVTDRAEEDRVFRTRLPELPENPTPEQRIARTAAINAHRHNANQYTVGVQRDAMTAELGLVTATNVLETVGTLGAGRAASTGSRFLPGFLRRILGAKISGWVANIAALVGLSEATGSIQDNIENNVMGPNHAPIATPLSFVLPVGWGGDAHYQSGGTPLNYPVAPAPTPPGSEAVRQAGR